MYGVNEESTEKVSSDFIHMLKTLLKHTHNLCESVCVCVCVCVCVREREREMSAFVCMYLCINLYTRLSIKRKFKKNKIK